VDCIDHLVRSMGFVSVIIVGDGERWN